MTSLPRHLRPVAIAWVLCWPVAADDPHSAQPSRPETAESAFDVGTEKLPVRFRGNSVEWVRRFGTLAPRSAVETDSDHASRRRAFRSEVFAFVLDTHHFDHDRRTGTIIVKVNPTTTRYGTKTGRSSAYAFDVHRTRLPPTTHARGAEGWWKDRPRVSERGAALSTTRAWKQTQIVTVERTFEVQTSLVLTLNMPRDLAAAARSNLRVALVCMPRLEQFETAKEPSMPEATGVDLDTERSGQAVDETITYFVALRCNLLQVWLFDRTTGEVYGRFTPQGAFVPR